jgi:acetyltransferase-like isoleucine patch superfamily enzyme
MRFYQGGFSPAHYSARFRPWLWVFGWASRWTQPVPAGLFLLNAFCQRVLGINAEVPWNVHFTSQVTGEVKIGRGVWVSFAVSSGCYIQGGNGIEIGDDTIFAPGVKIISANHQAGNLTVWDKDEPIRIGKRCWIGTNAVVLPGVQLGDDVIVGAGAVVTKSFPAKEVIGGVPARSLKVSRAKMSSRFGPK